MTGLVKFFHLSFGEQLLLIRSLSLLFMAHLCLRFLSLQTTRRLFSTRVCSATSHSVHQLVWAVTSASRRLPFISCMPRAIVAQRLLALHGFGAAMRIGVAPPGENKLQAHAWLEYEGEAVFGASELDRYTVLLTLEPERTPHV
ncbi:MAG: hypothetical protein QOG67_3030 [Verrucomicrobiota bacterium]